MDLTYAKNLLEIIDDNFSKKSIIRSLYFHDIKDKIIDFPIQANLIDRKYTLDERMSQRIEALNTLATEIRIDKILRSSQRHPDIEERVENLYSTLFSALFDKLSKDNQIYPYENRWIDLTMIPNIASSFGAYAYMNNPLSPEGAMGSILKLSLEHNPNSNTFTNTKDVSIEGIKIGTTGDILAALSNANILARQCIINARYELLYKDENYEVINALGKRVQAKNISDIDLSEFDEIKLSEEVLDKQTIYDKKGYCFAIIDRPNRDTANEYVYTIRTLALDKNPTITENGFSTRATVIDERYCAGGYHNINNTFNSVIGVEPTLENEVKEVSRFYDKTIKIAQIGE